MHSFFLIAFEPTPDDGQREASQVTVTIMGQTIASRLTKSRMSTGKTYDDVEIDYQTESTRFSATDRNEIERGIEHLNEHGYAVFTDVLSAAEVERSIDLFWSHIENLKLPQQLRRDDPKTWDDYW